MEIEGEEKVHVFVAVSRNQVSLEQLDEPSRPKARLLGKLPLNALLDGLVFPVHVSGGDLHEHPARRMPVLADQDDVSLGVYRDDRDAGAVVDPALFDDPAVGQAESPS